MAEFFPHVELLGFRARIGFALKNVQDYVLKATGTEDRRQHPLGFCHRIWWSNDKLGTVFGMWSERKEDAVNRDGGKPRAEDFYHLVTKTQAARLQL